MSLRIGGIATGMDLEGIVKDLMKVEQQKADRLEQQKTLVQWQQEAYQNINKKFANFILDTQKAFGLTKAGSSGFVKQSVNSLNWINSAVVGNEDIVQATARADAVAGTHTIEVERLATNWAAASGGAIGSEDGSVVLGENGVIDFTINGHRFTTQTIEELGGVSNVDLDNYSHIGVASDGTVKLTDIAKAINRANVGVSAHYDASIDRFFLQTTGTGTESKMTIEDNSQLIVDGGNQGFITGGESLLNLQYEVQKEDGQVVYEVLENRDDDNPYTGQNALINFGAAQGIEFQSNQFSLNNIDFNIKATGETSVTIDTDVDGVFDKILDFVNQYNELVDAANNLLTEKKNRSYTPLTQEQKDAMSDKEVELWEEKAKSGLLSRDIYLTRTMQQVRSGLYEEVQGGTGNYLLANFGITTERYVAGSMGGRLEIDETKLKEAIKNDADAVMELLFSQPYSEAAATDKNQQRAETGLVSRIYGDLIAGMKDVINKAGPGEDAALYRDVDSRMLLDFVVEQGSISFLQKDISKIDQRILDFQGMMFRKENSYWAQFTAMEKAINRMNAQAAWLAQQFGGGM